jgi:hypothetical protein
MKKWIVGLFVLTAMVFALTFSTAVPSSLAAPRPAAAPQPMPPHPEIQAAIDSLQHARDHLHEARHDFGGHREDAIKAIDGALHQLNICMRYDH